jgi:hypothetical protein
VKNMGIEELFYDYVPEDGGIYIDKSTAGIIVDGKRVD